MRNGAADICNENSINYSKEWRIVIKDHVVIQENQGQKVNDLFIV